MKKAIDLTGMRFNQLTVIKNNGCDKNKHTLWLCKCDCGEETNATTSQLNSDMKKSCGCIKNTIGDLTGRIFTNLTVQSHIKKNNKKYWVCQCVCGNFTEVTGTDLLKNKVKSCGCLRNTNTYELFNNYAVGLTVDNEKFYIDLEDYERVSGFVWRKNSDGYFETTLYYSDEKETLRLSRFIMNVYDERIVDHENHDKSDNRKNNLRVCNDAESVRNRGLFKNNTSGKTGVVWNKKNSVWIARITVDYKRIHLGCFYNYNDAVKARIEAEIKYFGEYRYKGDLT